VRNIQVISPFAGRTQWIVEKVVISTDDCSVLAAPTAWVNSDHPYIPIVNPSTRLWYVRQGEIIRHLVKPGKFVDKPTNKDHRAKMVNAADAIRITHLLIPDITTN
jgi:hypothetical protein